MFTSYFAKLRKLPPDIIPVAITVFPPKGYKGLVYKKLAPTPAILNSYKNNPDTEKYDRDFKAQVLNKLDAKEVVKELEALTGTDESHICLTCYEKSSDFCHRHLVRQFLSNELGLTVEEFLEEILMQKENELEDR